MDSSDIFEFLIGLGLGVFIIYSVLSTTGWGLFPVLLVAAVTIAALVGHLMVMRRRYHKSH